MLRGPSFIQVPGAPMVARLSVAISRAICLNIDSFTVERRRDAAYFLFRSYFESYGVAEDQKNLEEACHWLHTFARLAMASGPESLCFDIEENSKRMDRDVPPDFPLENCFRTGLQGMFKSGTYIRSVGQERTRGFPNLFNAALLGFREEGLRRWLPQQFRSTDLSTLLPAIGFDNSIVDAVALLHIAASCGDIHTASLLVKKYDLDLNVRSNFQDITP